MFEVKVSLFVINTRIVIIKRFSSVFEILHYPFGKTLPNENAIYVSNAKMYRLEDTKYHHQCKLYAYHIYQLKI
jgi:hypothetical protein